MKIYTRTGDDGETGLLGGDRIAKTSVRIAAVGDVDELNAALGLARIHATGDLDAELSRFQSWLFDLGAELAALPGGKFAIHSINGDHVAWIETSIDAMTRSLTPLKQFILPGGTPLAAQLHVARAVCRRAERSVLALAEESEVRSEPRHLLNRMSDWLFVAARFANAAEGVPDIAWSRTV